MTDFEQQVAHILGELHAKEVLKGNTSHTVRGWVECVIAPCVAAAIQVVIAELADCSEGLAAEVGAGSGDVRPQVQHDAEVVALAALRGEP